MRNFPARTGALILPFVIGLCLCAQPGRAEELSVTSSETKPVPIEDPGLGIFSRLPFELTLSVRGGYDDNVTTSDVFKQGSWFTNGNAALSYEFGSPRTQLRLAVAAGVTYFWESIRNTGQDTNDYDINSTIDFSLNHKATARLTLIATCYLTYQTEPDFALAQGYNRRGANYFYTSDKFTGIYLWTPRFSTASSYTFGAIQYDDEIVARFGDRFDNTFGNEFRFLVWPTTLLIAEYRYLFVAYDSIPRDTTSHFVLAGVDHSFNPRLSASLRAGAQFRHYEEPESMASDRTSPYFEGTLKYSVAKETSVSWTNRYSIEDTDVAISPSRETFRTGLSARHNLTPRVSASLRAYYVHDDYQSLNMPGAVSTAFTEDAIDFAVSCRYSVTRYFGVEAGFNHTEVTSDVALREYSRNRYWAGLNLSF